MKKYCLVLFLSSFLIHEKCLHADHRPNMIVNVASGQLLRPNPRSRTEREFFLNSLRGSCYDRYMRVELDRQRGNVERTTDDDQIPPIDQSALMQAHKQTLMCMNPCLTDEEARQLIDCERIAHTEPSEWLSQSDFLSQSCMQQVRPGEFNLENLTCHHWNTRHVVEHPSDLDVLILIDTSGSMYQHATTIGSLLVPRIAQEIARRPYSSRLFLATMGGNPTADLRHNEIPVAINLSSERLSDEVRTIIEGYFRQPGTELPLKSARYYQQIRNPTGSLIVVSITDNHLIEDGYLDLHWSETRVSADRFARYLEPLTRLASNVFSLSTYSLNTINYNYTLSQMRQTFLGRWATLTGGQLVNLNQSSESVVSGILEGIRPALERVPSFSFMIPSNGLNTISEVSLNGEILNSDAYEYSPESNRIEVHLDHLTAAQRRSPLRVVYQNVGDTEQIEPVDLDRLRSSGQNLSTGTVQTSQIGYSWERVQTEWNDFRRETVAHELDQSCQSHVALEEIFRIGTPFGETSVSESRYLLLAVRELNVNRIGCLKRHARSADRRALEAALKLYRLHWMQAVDRPLQSHCPTERENVQRLRAIRQVQMNSTRAGNSFLTAVLSAAQSLESDRYLEQIASCQTPR